MTAPMLAVLTATLLAPRGSPVLPRQGYTDAFGEHGARGHRSARSGNLDSQFEHLYKVTRFPITDRVAVMSGPVAVELNQWAKSPGKTWEVRLGDSAFRISIEDRTKLELGDVTDRVERIPALYRRALEIISEPGKDGLAFYKDLGGAAAHGGQDYINAIPSADLHVITHEAGHTIEQRAKVAEPDILERWNDAISTDKVSVSWYGNGAHWEDQAEFARIYAACINAGPTELARLQQASPARYALWERMLELVEARVPVAPTVPPPTFSPCSQPGWKTKAAVCAGSKIRGVCPNKVTRAAAEALCADVSARLCSVAELKTTVAKGTGCQLDSKHVWAADDDCRGTLSRAAKGKHGRKPKCLGVKKTAGVRCCAEL